MALWSLSYLLWIGYPPLIAYFVAVILYTIRNSTGDSLGPNDNNAERVTFIFFPQYLTILLFPLFHFIVSLQHKRWTVVLLKTQINSLFFTLFAGSSLFPVALFTDGFRLRDSISESIIFGLILLIIIQFYGYSVWPYISLKRFETYSQLPLQLRRNSMATHVLYIVSVCYGVFGLALYTGCAIANWSMSNNKAYTFICSAFSKFCIVLHYLLVVLFVLLEGLMFLYIHNILGFKKRRWIGLMIAPLNSLVGLFLGYNVYILCYTLGTYHKLPLFAKFFISRLSLKLFKGQLAASVAMILSIVSMNVSLGLKYWSDMGIVAQAKESPLSTRTTTNHFDTEEGTALIANSSEYFNNNEQPE